MKKISKTPLALLITGIVCASSYAIADTHKQSRIAGDGTNNPEVSQLEYDNIIKLRYGSYACTSTVIAGRWLLSTAHCGRVSSPVAYFDTAHNTRHYSHRDNTVYHPERMTSSSESVLMKVDDYVGVTAFNPISPIRMKEIEFKEFCMRTGLNEYFHNSYGKYCETRFDIDVGQDVETEVTGEMGEQLYIYGYAGTYTLRRARVEAVNDHRYSDVIRDSVFMGAFPDGFYDHDEGGVNTEGGDSGAAYIDMDGYIRGVHYGKHNYGKQTTTHADQIAYNPEWILDTIDAWNYAGLVYTEDDQAVVRFQSLHTKPVDLLNTVSTDGVEIDLDSISCKAPSSTPSPFGVSSASGLIVEPWDVCEMTITNISNAEGKIYLSNENIITVDKGRIDDGGDCDDGTDCGDGGGNDKDDDGGSMGGSVILLGIYALFRRFKK